MNIDVNVNQDGKGQIATLMRKKSEFQFFEKLVRQEGVSIFCLGSVGEVGQICGWVAAGYKTHRVLSYELDTPSDALDNQIGPSVWPLCFKVMKPEPQKTDIWEIPGFSIGTYIG